MREHATSRQPALTISRRQWPVLFSSGCGPDGSPALPSSAARPSLPLPAQPPPTALARLTEMKMMFSHSMDITLGGTKDHLSHSLKLSGPENWFFIRNALKQMKKLSEEASVIQDPDVPRVFSNYLASLKDANKKLIGEIDGPEIVISTTPRLSILRRSTLDPNVNQFLQDTFSSSRKLSKAIDPSSGLPVYDRKMKNLMEKAPYIKPEQTSTLLKPEEVLSCRYLRLSKNNIQTLLRLCKEAGMEIDIHPHMNESEMNANKIFTQKPSIAL